MTVRLPADLDARLEMFAATQHTSKHALLAQATRALVDSEERIDRAMDVAAGVRGRYADLLKRLEDA